MSFLPLNTLEDPSLKGEASNRQVLVNLEPTSLCDLTPVCGDSCILTQTHRNAGEPLASDIVESLITEVLAAGKTGNIRHVMLAAKEPTKVPEHVVSLAKAWHLMPVDERPLSIGMISASWKGIEALIPLLAGNPLSSVLISLDTSVSGLRTPNNNARLVDSALKARALSAIDKIGVNTTLQQGDLENVLAIGRDVQKAEVDQWTVAGFAEPVDGEMRSVLSRKEYAEIITRLSAEFGSCGMRVTIDLPHDYFDLVGGINPDTWRTEHEVAPGVFGQTFNPRPGFFARVRWDGEILGLEQSLRVGTRTGKYGSYVPGMIPSLMDRIVSERN